MEVALGGTLDHLLRGSLVCDGRPDTFSTERDIKKISTLESISGDDVKV